MINPALVADLTNRGWVATAEQTTTVAETWLDVAWRALQREADVPDLVSRMLLGDLDSADVVDVVAAAALRVLRNPDGNVAEAVSIDDYREDWRKSDTTQDVYFTAAEKRRLQPVVEAVVHGWSGSIGYCR